LSRVALDIRYSARKFVRTPWATLALLLTIALGVGSNVSVYGFARGLTGSEAPVASADRVVSIFARDANREAGPLSYQEYLSFKTLGNVFEWVGAARVSPVNLTIAGQSQIATLAAVTSDLAVALNLPMGKGAIAGRRMWQSEFGAEAAVHDAPIRINKANVRVGGVARNRLEGLYRDRAVDLWMPLEEKSLQGADRRTRNLWVLARLHRGVSIHQAQIALDRGQGTTSEILIRPYTGMTPEMQEGLSRIGLLFSFAAGAVFFIACANVISLLLGRALARSHETSLRVALGARRIQLARELFWDSVVISVFGGALGALLAVWTTHVVPALLFEQDAERLVFAPDLFSIIAASTACIGVTVLCGLTPVLATADDRPNAVLKSETAGPSNAMRRLRLSLVVGQMTSCCLLVISTAYLLSGLRTALQTSAGHRLGDPILLTVQAQPQIGVDISYFQRVQQAAHSMHGISPMAWAGLLPGSQPTWRSFRIEPHPLPKREIPMDIAWFTSDSLKLFTLPPIQGHLFGFEDQTCRVAIVNAAAAAELFGGKTAGRTIQDAAGLPVEIIGVVESKVRHAGKGSRATIYYNYANQTAPPPARTDLVRFRAPIRSELATAQLDTNVVSESYFETMGISLIAGREFMARRLLGECRVAIINQEASDLYFGGKPIGAAVIDDKNIGTVVIGVVHSKPLGVFERRAEPAVYFPMSQDCLPTMTLLAGARNVNDSTFTDLRRTIEAVPGRGPAPVVIKTLSAHLAHTALAPLRIATIIIGASAATGLLLSILGLFSALGDAARQRRRELAIRIALGAQRWRIVCQVLGEGGRLACAGTLIGMIASLALSRWLNRIAPGDTSPAFWVWLAAPLMLAIAVVIASVLPARRASLLNPLTIMRDDN
jgi:ABC-type lipoprotein release transport system permease subunit